MLLWLIIKLISSEIEVSIDIPKMERIGNIECDSKICWSTTRGALKTSFSYYIPDGFDYLTIFFKGVSEANTTFDAYLDDNLGFTVNSFLDLKKWSLPYWNDSIYLSQTKNYDLTIIGSNFLINRIFYLTALAPTITPQETPIETPFETPQRTPEETPFETPQRTPEETPQETPSMSEFIEYQKEIIKESNKKAIVGLSVGFGLSIFFVFVLAAILIFMIIRYKRKQVSEKEIDDEIKYPSDEEKKEEEQSNPLFELELNHDPFDEIEG